MKKKPGDAYWKARAIRALEGPLAAQELLLPCVNSDKEESQLRDYLLEL